MNEDEYYEMIEGSSIFAGECFADWEGLGMFYCREEDTMYFPYSLTQNFTIDNGRNGEIRNGLHRTRFMNVDLDSARFIIQNLVVDL